MELKNCYTVEGHTLQSDNPKMIISKESKEEDSL